MIRRAFGEVEHVAVPQDEEYLAEIINPILDANKEELGMTAEINV